MRTAFFRLFSLSNWHRYSILSPHRMACAETRSSKWDFIDYVCPCSNWYMTGCILVMILTPSPSVSPSDALSLNPKLQATQGGSSRERVGELPTKYCSFANSVIVCLPGRLAL
ncbi:hypothetical protein BaRGS_00036357 [Batillaria attramentaria]|uniref:Uncharacterized protein n=1 Tax=Batillaria attramentaria TaxID=370345 RepID=A0ABD0JC47_9CAEN